jgi:hypothetical protein
MRKTNIKIKGGIEIVSIMITAGVLCALAAILLLVLTFTLKPESVIKNDVASTKELFNAIDTQMALKSHGVFMTLDPTGETYDLVSAVVTNNGIESVKDFKNYKEINPAMVDYYTDFHEDKESAYTVTYSINFSESKVDNIYLVRKIQHESYFGPNEHATLSHIIFNLNKEHNIKPATSLRLELTPIKMTNGEAYHYFAKEADITKPVAFDACKETLDCVYISRYRTTIPKSL